MLLKDGNITSDVYQQEKEKERQARKEEQERQARKEEQERKAREREQSIALLKELLSDPTLREEKRLEYVAILEKLVLSSLV
jgi:hypothetical protein